jgi:hypothetical protein
MDQGIFTAQTKTSKLHSSDQTHGWETDVGYGPLSAFGGSVHA